MVFIQLNMEFVRGLSGSQKKTYFIICKIKCNLYIINNRKMRRKIFQNLKLTERVARKQRF